MCWIETRDTCLKGIRKPSLVKEHYLEVFVGVLQKWIAAMVIGLCTLVHGSQASDASFLYELAPEKIRSHGVYMLFIPECPAWATVSMVDTVTPQWATEGDWAEPMWACEAACVAAQVACLIGCAGLAPYAAAACGIACYAAAEFCMLACQGF
jgi:hypothetical protein